MNNKSRLLVLVFISLLALSLPVLTSLVSKRLDDRSKATEETSNSKISFKIAFSGIKPNYSCLSSLKTINMEVVNVTNRAYQSNIEASLTPVTNETNKDGDQVFLVSNQALESKFNTVDSSNYLMINTPSFLTTKLCLNQQASKVGDSIPCNLDLKNTNTSVYDFSNYPLIPGDINQDGIVNTSDFSIVKSNIDSDSETDCSKEGDINFDGMVNVFDIGYLKNSLLNTADEGTIDTSTITPTATYTPTPTETKFAVTGDIHNCTSCLEKIIKRAKDDGIQILILAGDLTTNGTKDELTAIKKVLDSSDMKYVVTPGNHDGYKGLYYSVFELGFQSFKINGNKFILIDDSSYKSLNYNSKTADQKNWIVSEVGECKTVTCIVVMHRPVNHPSSDHVMGEDNSNSMAEAKWLLKLLVDNKIKEIESGHIHRFETYIKGGMKTNLVGPGQYSRFSEFTIDSAGNISRKEMSKY